MKRLFGAILCACILLGCLAGCGSADDAYIPTGDGMTWDEDYTGPTSATRPDETVQDLSLAYRPSASMNPYLCTDITNRVLFSLIYQGLFTVDRDYNVEPMLCARYTVSDDMTSYTFYVAPRHTPKFPQLLVTPC